MTVTPPELCGALPHGTGSLVGADQELKEEEFTAWISALEQQVGQHAAATLIERALRHRVERGVELGIAQGDPASGSSQATLLVPFTMHTRPGLHGMPAQGSIAPQPAEKR